MLAICLCAQQAKDFLILFLDSFKSAQQLIHSVVFFVRVRAIDSMHQPAPSRAADVAIVHWFAAIRTDSSRFGQAFNSRRVFASAFWRNLIGCRIDDLAILIYEPPECPFTSAPAIVMAPDSCNPWEGGGHLFRDLMAFAVGLSDVGCNPCWILGLHWASFG